MDGDYYSTVYTWFERSGLLANVRTHLRQNLVNALKSKDTTLNKDNTGAKSAKQYVYDLLVAEYLWNHNYAYTLSVFASEAPLLVNFCKNLSTVVEESREKQKLQDDYVQHTLETLGIRPEDSAGQSIIANYAENDMPLLLCILKCASQSLVNNKAERSESDRHKNVHNCETQTEDRYQRCSEISKLTVAKKKLFKQKELFDKQLKEREDELKQQACLVEQQIAELNEKLVKAQNLMQSVHLKERHLMEAKKEQDYRIYKRDIELSAKENLLAREAERLKKERDSYGKFEADLKKLQDELINVKKELPRKPVHAGDSSRDVQVQTESNSFITESLAANRERAELSNLVKVQQSRIEELTLRAVSLSRQLEQARLVKKKPIEIPAPAAPISKSSTVLSDSSSTEDILRDAKIRLKRLEEESLKADECYFNCMTTLLL